MECGKNTDSSIAIMLTWSLEKLRSYLNIYNQNGIDISYEEIIRVSIQEFLWKLNKTDKNISKIPYSVPFEKRGIPLLLAKNGIAS